MCLHEKRDVEQIITVMSFIHNQLQEVESGARGAGRGVGCGVGQGDRT